MSEAEDKARDALLSAISVKSKRADIDELGKLATAYQQVVHGPQGGSMDYDYDGRTQYDQTLEQNTQHHQHQHLEAGRNGVGFGQ